MAGKKGKTAPKGKLEKKKLQKPASKGNKASRMKKATPKKGAPAQPPGLLRFTFISIYRYLYILGITLLRRWLRLRRKYFGRLQHSRSTATRHARRGFRRLLLRITRSIKAPFVAIRSVQQDTRALIRAKRAKGEPVGGLYLELLYPVFRFAGKAFAFLLSYAAPVLALLVLLHVVNQSTESHWVLEVQYNGVTAYVQDESQFENALQDIKDRFSGSDAESLIAEYTTGIPHFTLTESSNRTPVITSSELADRIIETQGGDVEYGYGLYIDEEFYGAVTDVGDLFDELEAILNANRTGKRDEELEFDRSIRVKDKGLYPSSSIVPVSEISAVLHSYETVEETYTIVEGDSLSLIADKNGLSMARLLEMNPGLDERDLFPGDEIRTAIARPFLSVRNSYIDIYDEEFDFETEEFESPTHAKTYREVLAEGENGVMRVTARIYEVNGLETQRSILEQNIVKDAVNERVLVGTNDPLPEVSSGGTGEGSGNTNVDRTPSTASPGSSGFIWPGGGRGYITAGLYGYAGHTGIDIFGTGGTGSNVYASAGGVVTTAKRGYTGYGQYIVINHGNGYETLYAHNSDLYVNVGDYVEQGDVIAAVGSTGNSTGPHIHFEVKYQGRVMDPVNYVGRGPS